MVKGAREQHNEHDLSNSNNNIKIPGSKKVIKSNNALPSQKNMQTLTPLRLDSDMRYKI